MPAFAGGGAGAAVVGGAVVAGALVDEVVVGPADVEVDVSACLDAGRVSMAARSTSGEDEVPHAASASAPTRTALTVRCPIAVAMLRTSGRIAGATRHISRTMSTMAQDEGPAPAGRRSSWWRRLRTPVLIMLAVFVVMQLVPYGWQHPNPPVTDDAPWPGQRAAAIARAACYDCHSNETEWPVYSYVAPMSWLVRRDVEQGRDELNFSEWDDHDSEADDAAEAVMDGSMPPSRYVRLHPDADLSDAEVGDLVAALERMED